MDASIFQNFQIRWLIRRDMDEILEIEQQSFDSPWLEDDFLACLRQRNCIGAVAECYFIPEGEFRVLGYIIWELNPADYTILNFAVHPAVRRQKVGSKMIERLMEKLSNQRRSKIIAMIERLMEKLSNQRRSKIIAMIERLMEKLSNQRRSKIIASIGEANLQAHLFFQACGFKAIAVEKDQYKFVFRMTENLISKVENSTIQRLSTDRNH